MKFKLLVYDLDGTLVDTRHDIAHAVNHALGVMGREALALETIWGHVGQGMHHLIGSCLGTQDPKLIEKGAKLYRERYKAHMLDHSKPYPGALDFLQFFQGRKQIVMTNKPDPFSSEILGALGMAGFFSVIITADPASPKKPDPAVLLQWMKKNSIRPDEAVMIGDSAIDIATARNAGMMCACLSHGFSSREELKTLGPDGIFDSFDALLQFARGQGW